MKIIIGVKKGRNPWKVKRHLVDDKGNSLCGVSPIFVLADKSWTDKWDDRHLCRVCRKHYKALNA
jgi:hypothetical protein